jgi:Tfp pilus assembly protein PilN
MRELEFLPEWYPRSRQRKRIVLLQGYMTLLLATGLGTWLILVDRNTQTAAGALANIETQISQTHQEMHQLEEQVTLKDRLLVQREIIQKLGLPVEMSRLLFALDQNLPPQISLTDLSFDIQEKLKVAGSLAAARNAAPGNNMGDNSGDNIDRRLHVRLDGVAPTDTDIANFLTGLAKVTFFDDVVMSFTRDRPQNGRVLREFEVTFSVNLNPPAGG